MPVDHDDDEKLTMPLNFVPQSPETSSETTSDIERSSFDNTLNAYDPYALRTKLRDPNDIAELRKRGNSKMKNRVGKFYEQQNEKIEAMLKSLETHAQEGTDDAQENALKVKIAIRLSFIANCLLSVLQLYAAISSLSLSFFATAADSVFDPVANLLLGWLHHRSQRVDMHRYPGGGARLTVIGNIVYSFAMLSVSILLVAFSAQDLATHKDGETKDFFIPSIVAVGAALVTKFLLFLYCFSIRNSSSQVQVLWEDHRNDLLVNGFGLFTSAAGSKIKWWIDPMGAIIISVVIVFAWTKTSIEQFSYLAGKAAPHEFTQLVTYKALTFSEDIKKIDNCIAYHSGEKYVVEVDIVMDAETPLWKTHDVSQDLQDQLERLPKVERAFVHVDHEVHHKPEHRKDL
ncbi:CDF-like metal transporter [Marasmius fiardii PR-910]|nr:CDF-like metal transporter [Marasmius fiardii PR-910]